MLHDADIYIFFYFYLFIYMGIFVYSESVRSKNYIMMYYKKANILLL